MVRCASFFSGIGGIDLAFLKAGFEVVYANEIDEYAIKTYEANFDLKVDRRDIREVLPDDIPDFEVMLAGFPCQPFSIAGKKLGLSEPRGNLYFELERIFKAKKPKVIFLENVKNFVTHDKGNTFKVIRDSLISSGYKIKWKVMNTCEYGNIPQNRERIYIVAFADEDMYKRFSFPNPVELTNTPDKFIN